MKKFLAAGLFFLVLATAAWAGPWAILANAKSNNIHILDLGQSPPRVYGPFLTGQLGSGSETLLDAAVTTDGRYAIVTSFYGRKVYRIDVSDPANPVLLNAVSTGTFFPEGIAISPDGNFAVVTDGYSTQSNVAYFFNMADFAHPSIYQTRIPGGTYQGVGIAADNSTVILCDVARNRIYYGRVNSTYSGLISESELLGDGGAYYGPLNVAISPDGKTVLTANSWSGYINVFQINSPGVIVPGATPKIVIHNAPQTIVFSPDGRNAYVLANGYPSRDTVCWLRINGTGNVSLANEYAATLLTASGTSYYGVHTLAMHPTQNYAIAGFSSPTSLTGVAYINLTTWAVSQITTGQGDTAGVATFVDAVFPPINPALTRVTNNFLFYKEYVNRLTWQANPKNKVAISKYRIFIKKSADPDTSYQLYKEVDASVLSLDDRGLRRDDLFTYKLTAVNVNGMESPTGVVVGN